nr:hyp [Cotesia vestalis bracovirus]
MKHTAEHFSRIVDELLQIFDQDSTIRMSSGLVNHLANKCCPKPILLGYLIKAHTYNCLLCSTAITYYNN